MRWACVALALIFSSASADVDGQDLAARIAAAQNVIWPEQVFIIGFEGCELHVRQSAPNERTDSRSATWVLSDFETEPSRLVISAQRMAEGPNVWVDSNVVYPLRKVIRQAYANDIARYETAADEIYGEGTSNWGWLWRRGQISAETNEKSTKLYDDRRSGVYGPLLQRNIGIAEGESVLDGPYYETYGLIDTDLGFVFRDDVMDGILQDVHAYTLENCPPSD